MTKTRFTKEQRQAIHAKYGYRCAYCGKPITYSEMQVDHLIPQFLKGSAAHQHLVEQIDSFDNLMPSCRRCNHYKRGNSIETFREWIRTIPSKLMRDSYIFKVGCDYGMWNSQNPPSIKFYFEMNQDTEQSIEKHNKLLDINFSPKQDMILLWWFDVMPTHSCNGIIVDGGIHSGKSVVTGLSFLMWAMKKFENKTFLIAGKTNSWVFRHIVNPLKPFLDSDFEISEHIGVGNTYFILRNKQTGVINQFYICGSRDECSAITVSALSLSGVLFDEPVLMSQAFVNQCIARCSDINAKWWFTCTPESPYHWFYQNWIRKIDEKHLYYQHLSLDDNLSLSEEEKQRYRNLYSGVYYSRMIDGKWRVAEGQVYYMFNETNNVVDINFDSLKPYIEHYYISVDYGTVNPFSAALWGTYDNQIVRLKEYYHNSRDEGIQLTDEEYYQNIKLLAEGVNVDKLIIDPSAASFIATVKRHNEFDVYRADNDLGIIGYICDLIESGNLAFLSSCEHILKEISTYKWSDRGDQPVKANDHCCDDMRFFISYYYKYYYKHLKA